MLSRHNKRLKRSRARSVFISEPTPNTVAPWFVEEVRKELDRRDFGSDMVHQSGLRVYTTLDLKLQEAARRCRPGWTGCL